MLASPRSFGHTFNPLSVYWCVAPDGELRWVLLEVHNTYGGRHHHLIEPDEQGRATVPKEFYVSPFLTIEGEYHVRVQLDAQRVAVDIDLHQDGRPMLSARVAGAVGRARASRSCAGHGADAVRDASDDGAHPPPRDLVVAPPRPGRGAYG